MPLFGLGIFILWLGWFGFNPGSTLGALDGRFPEVVLTTNIAAAGGVLTAVLTAYWKTKTIDIGMAGNGAIAALVAITAPSGYVVPWAALVIGAIAGVIVVLGVYAIDKKIDDPVGALSAHGLAGIWGTLACGLFTASEAGVLQRRRRRRAALHGLVPPARRPGPRRGRRLLWRVHLLLHRLRDHQGDLRDARVRGRGAGRSGHLRARDVRVPRAVHPGSGARRLRCGPSRTAAAIGAGPIATPTEVPAT